MISVKNIMAWAILGITLTVGLNARRISFTFVSKKAQPTHYSINTFLTDTMEKLDVGGIESEVSSRKGHRYTCSTADTLPCILKIVHTDPDTIQSALLCTREPIALSTMPIARISPSTDIIIPAGSADCNILISIAPCPDDENKSYVYVTIALQEFRETEPQYPTYMGEMAYGATTEICSQHIAYGYPSGDAPITGGL